MTRDEQLAELEKQLGGIEENLAKLADDGVDLDGDLDEVETVVKRRPLAKKKAVEAAEEDEEDMDEEFDFGKKPVKKSVENDETITIEGQAIAKSAVGETHFAILKGQADRLAKAETEIAKERDARIFAELQKRADAEYAHVPGSTDERATMLKALSAMEEPVRKSFEAVFQAAEKLAKTAFDRVGVNAADADDVKKSVKGFETKVAEIRKRDNCTRTDALAKARQEDPEGFKAFQGSN